MAQSIILVNEYNKITPTEELLSATNLTLEDIDPFQTLEIKLMNEANSIGIVETKAVIEWDSKKCKKNKLCIIRDAHHLTNEAQNALLKVVEEPSEKSIIIFETNNDKALLKTIRSRCLIIYSKNANLELSEKIPEFLKYNFLERKNYFEEILKSENKRVEIKNFIHELTNYLIKSRSEFENNIHFSNMLEFLKLAYIANKKSVNTKVVLDNINNYLELLLNY